MIILQVMEKQLGKVKGRRDLQLKIIAELHAAAASEKSEQIAAADDSQGEMVMDICYRK